MAECPFCFAVINTNDILRGKIKACPRCGKNLGFGGGSTTTAPAPAPPSSPAPVPVPLVARKPKKYRDAEDEEAAPVAAGRAAVEDDEPEERPPLITRLASADPAPLTAFVLGSVGLTLASVPPFTAVGKLLGLAALLIGIGGGIVPAVRNGRSLVFPAFVSVVGLVVVLFLGSWPRLPQLMPAGPSALPLNPAADKAQPVNEEAWVDASRSVLRDRDLRIQVVSAQIVPVDTLGKAKPAKLTGKVLSLQLAIGYEGVTYRTFNFEGWHDTSANPSRHAPTLTDHRGQRYAQIGLDSAKAKEEAAAGPLAKSAPAESKLPALNLPKGSVVTLDNKITPGRQLSERLVYPAPPPDVEYLRLELPASALGLEGRFRFQIPRSMIHES